MSGPVDIVRVAAQDAIDAYKRQNPMRTADFHQSACDCLRCAMDNLEAALLHDGGGK